MKQIKINSDLEFFDDDTKRDSATSSADRYTKDKDEIINDIKAAEAAQDTIQILAINEEEIEVDEE